jgi:hypothetical protein
VEEIMTEALKAEVEEVVVDIMVVVDEGVIVEDGVAIEEAVVDADTTMTAIADITTPTTVAVDEVIVTTEPRHLPTQMREHNRQQPATHDGLM